MSGPTCFKCGRECDMFMDVEWDEQREEYIGYCRWCAESDLRLISVLNLVIELQHERAKTRLWQTHAEEAWAKHPELHPANALRS